MDKTTFAERIRTASDKELATILLNYLEGAIMPWCVINNMPVPKFDEAMILSQLQTATENYPRAYTLEEMKEMRGQRVYVHYMGPCHGFYKDEYMPFFGDDEIGIKLINEQYSRLHMPLNLYNKSWVALAYKPNETTCVLDETQTRVRLQPLGTRGFACDCCGDALMPHNEVWICPDCGAVICSDCVKTGKVEAHVCEEDEYCEEDE